MIEIAQLFRSRGGVLGRADGFPPHPDRFAEAGYDLAALLAPGPDRAYAEINGVPAGHQSHPGRPGPPGYPSHPGQPGPQWEVR